MTRCLDQYCNYASALGEEIDKNEICEVAVLIWRRAGGNRGSQHHLAGGLRHYPSQAAHPDRSAGATGPRYSDVEVALREIGRICT